MEDSFKKFQNTIFQDIKNTFNWVDNMGQEGTVQKAQNGTEWYRIGTEWYRMPKRHRMVQNKNVQKAQNGIE